MKRRVFLAALWPALAVAQEPDPAPAAPFIDRTGRELGALIAANPDPAQLRTQLQPFLDRVVDIEGLGRFSIGRYWQTATAAQRTEYLTLFRLAITKVVASRLGAATSGVSQAQIGRPEFRDGVIQVPTLVERPNNRPNRIVWWLTPSAGTYKVVDVTAEGISLRLTQRSDYTAFLNQHGGDLGALIEALRAQLS